MRYLMVDAGKQQIYLELPPDYIASYMNRFSYSIVSTLTSFSILTQEDWNKVLYNGMASTSPVAALYFIALMTFGNYVLFNLLVAILVEGFQTEVTLTHYFERPCG
ncbi:Voltage-dependent T-type calcium channel subunit alpha-1G [Goodea atripinnis]|uniref:Voltage-dependent T-type calcium channel subunit alpha-1G n=1 Tax=Goodea atripinnis TaxID=208336 RepID=A0ABV0NQ84_9TELE